jgi:hypothetical protein
VREGGTPPLEKQFTYLEFHLDAVTGNVRNDDSRR